MTNTAVAIAEPAQSLRIVTPMELLERATSSNATPETLEKLLSLQERWEKSEARKAFDDAIAEAKSKIRPVMRNRTGHNNKKYADFAAIAQAVDPILSQHGLSYRFRSEPGDKINVTCILSHRAGHSEETTLTGPADTTGNKNAVQAIGSTLSYLQRYSVMQALGLAAADDDDGQTGGAKPITQEQADEIRELLESTGASREKFLTWAKVEKVEDIPEAHFDSCLAAIKKAGKK